ncbi:galactose oxidase early set domain-containing protein [Streptomyces sp. NPDC046942]|uniref:galactose oxidase early set domain-containing protein n=1 Tax=Streptomyces sp. NPDC046942 TaxID=3155137 RepID=UPI0033FC2D74
MSRRGIPRSRRWTFAAGCAVVVLSVTAPAALGSTPSARHGFDPHPGGVRITREQIAKEIRPEEVKALGRPRAEQLARDRIGLRAVDTGYPQPIRTRSLKEHTDSQAEANAAFSAAQSGEFKQYIKSPDYGDHVALLPTGKVLLFSFEAVEDNPNKETAPTQVIGRQNAGRAYVWTPPAPDDDTGTGTFKAVPPPTVDMDDGLNEPRPAPIFCAGHAYLPNGMVGIFGGNLGGNHGTGAHLAFVFDPWTETWHRQQDMAEGRWYPSVVTGADGRQFITSGHGDVGWGKLSKTIERFPAKNTAVSFDKSSVPDNQQLDKWPIKADYATDYPHLFSLRDGRIYGFGRDYNQQYVFDPATETSQKLADRPDEEGRKYGSAVPLPNPTPGNGPDSALILGGDRNNPKTYRFSNGSWTTDSSRAFGRTMDDTLIFPDGRLWTVNGAFDIRDYGNGEYNPTADDKWRQTELRDVNGTWKLGPQQRLPRGYHSNAVILPDGRIMITGDELQEIANNPDIKSGMNGSIEIFKPPYLNQGGDRPGLRTVPDGPVGYDTDFQIDTTNGRLARKVVLMAPITSTHSVDTSQRRIELKINARAGNTLDLQSPLSAKDAPPGYYLLYVLDDRGVPSIGKWVQLRPGA